MAKQKKPAHVGPGAPRGIRFPDPLHKRLAADAARTQRTFSDMVIYLVRKGYELADLEERDRQAGERARRKR
jgi:hypothetical protein